MILTRPQNLEREKVVQFAMHTSNPLNELLKKQNLQDTWRKCTPTKLIIYITELYPIFIVDWIGFIPLNILSVCFLSITVQSGVANNHIN